MGTIKAVNPATGKTVREYEEMNAEEVRGILEGSQSAFQSWKTLGYARRSELMRSVSKTLSKNKDRLALQMAEEMGKPVREGRGEVEKCAWVCDYYAENASKFLQDDIVETEARKSYVTFQPLGVVLAVMPWNFPLWQVFRFAAPTLSAGNVCVLKHASNVPGCALSIEEMFLSAGFPEEVFRTLLIGGSAVGSVIEDPRVAAVTLTGSAAAGRDVAGQAGRHLKKTVLELGGSDPHVILEDADLESAVENCVVSRLLNAGQSCIGAKRFIVVDSIREEFQERFVDRMKTYEPGDPTRDDTRLGPLARHDLRDELHRQVQGSVARGARCLLGGSIPPGPGAFYPPTVLTDVEPGMPAYDEELFGPVAAIISVKNEKEAVRTANDTPFGLGAAVYTRDTAKGERIAAEELNAGCCYVNKFVSSDPRLPFGGVKESGYGRELASYGIREFVNVKTVYIA